MSPGRVSRRDFGAVGLAVLTLAARARAATIGVASASRLTPAADLPYSPPVSLSTVADMYRRMTVPVQIAGQGPFPFVVDTGANQSVIALELAQQLGLALGARAAVNGAAGMRMAPTSQTTLQLGRRAPATATFMVLPKDSVGGLGMLGLDLLENQTVTLDFKGQALRIEGPGRLWRRDSDIAMKAHRRDGQLTLVDTDLAGVHITAFLDSGAQNTVGNLPLRDLATARHPTAPTAGTIILSATGQTIDAEILGLPDLRVGGMHLPNWPVAFADLFTFKLWGLDRRPAIMLGVDVLSRFEMVSLDFYRDEVRFRLPGADAA